MIDCTRGVKDKVLPSVRRRFEELGCLDQVDIYGVAPSLKKKREPGTRDLVREKTGILLGKVLIYIMSYYRNFMLHLIVGLDKLCRCCKIK